MQDGFLERARTELVTALEAGGYDDLGAISEVICGLGRFTYTTAVVVGLDETSYKRRYCYEHKGHAEAVLPSWDGEGYPSGPWIKCKVAGIDLFNPAFR